MALRLGVGDAFTICKGVVDLCRATHPEPKEVQLICTEMESIRAHLKALENQIGDEKTFSTTRPDISPIIKRSLEPLRKDLLQMNDILSERSRRQSVHILDKVKWMVLYKARLEGFRDKLPVHRESISVMRELIDGESQSERRASMIRLEELVEICERQEEEEELNGRAQEEVVKTFEELHGEDGGRHLSTCEMLEKLENDLMSKGMTPERTGQQMFPITKALLLQPLPEALNRGPLIRGSIFRLDVFGSGSSSDEGLGVEQGTGKEGSVFKKTRPKTMWLNRRASSMENLRATYDDERDEPRR